MRKHVEEHHLTEVVNSDMKPELQPSRIQMELGQRLGGDFFFSWSWRSYQHVPFN